MSSRSDLPDLRYFLAIARHGNFRRAGTEIGLSASALSHAMKALEARLGIRLLHRTNRSVTLTAAGENLHRKLERPFQAIDAALDDLNAQRATPTGRIRVNLPYDASILLLHPILPTFIRRWPGVAIEVTPEDRYVDLAASGCDAGVRYGGTVPDDMVSQRLSPDLKWVVVGSPSYLEREGRPRHPNELSAHQCVRIRTGQDRLYRWEFESQDESFAIDAPGSLTTISSTLGIEMARAGTGLFYCLEARVANLLQTGELEVVLRDWTPKGPGFFVYYSSRRQVPHGLRLLIDLIREAKPIG